MTTDSDQAEHIILQSLLYDEQYARQTLPYLEAPYFADLAQRHVFDTINAFYTKYNKPPSLKSLCVEIADQSGINELIYNDIVAILGALQEKPEFDTQWAIDTTEKFCKQKAIYNCIMQSIDILDGKNQDVSEQAIPQLMQIALAVSFDQTIGHDYFDDADERWDYYHLKEHKVATGLKYLDEAMDGGPSNKTLNVLMGGTGVGKTLVLCALAANNLKAGENVLYITNEISEKEIGKRIDANLLNVPMNELKDGLTKADYARKIAGAKAKSKHGKLIVHEYPTGSAHSGHIRHLINELKMKKNFTPSVIYIDYLNICASARYKPGRVGMYDYVKSIAEELRALAIEMNVPIWSATQSNREGYRSSDPSITDTSESFGLPATCDWFAVLITSDELNNLGQMMFKQEKSRYGDINQLRKFVVGVEKPKMQLYDLDDAAQKGISQGDSGSVMDNTQFGERSNNDTGLLDGSRIKSGKFRSLLS